MLNVAKSDVLEERVLRQELKLFDHVQLFRVVFGQIAREAPGVNHEHRRVLIRQP